MNIMQMRRGMGKGMNYPYDHKVEYITSVPQFYITLPVTSQVCYGYDFTFYFVGGYTYQRPFRDVNNHFGLEQNNAQDTGIIRIKNAGTYLSRWFPVGSKVRYYTTTDNIAFCSYSTQTKAFTPPLSTGGGAIRMPGAGNPSPIRIYKAILYDENRQKLFDGIPVRVGSIGYIYDKITKQLYGSNGDSFTCGPDLIGGGITA